MTSAQFATVAIESITIDRASRQRREIRDVESLADSIRNTGLINPPVVTRDLRLVAGERRLTACLSLGWTSIPIQYADTIDPSELHLIELEENVKRSDLDWKDQVRAVEEYHRLRREADPAWTMSDTASALGQSAPEISRKMAVAAELTAGNPLVVAAPKYSVARGVVERAVARSTETELSKLKSTLLKPQATPVFPDKLPDLPPADDGSDAIILGDFNVWAPAYSGQRFNLLHCDFPYGINAGDFNQGSAKSHGGYEDSEDTYWGLLNTLAANLDRLVTPSAHLIFWFSMTHYQPTLSFLTKETDFVISPFPLVWHKSDNVGILPDPNHGPRRTYETAFFGYRGGRPVVQAVANSYAGPTIRERHMSEKPEPMLRHFLRMCVDSNTVALDPTSGSGSSIRACEALGGTALGLERDDEYVTRSRRALLTARQLRTAGKELNNG